MAKIQTFELDRWSEPDENHRVKHIGMADAKETFDKLKTHLEAHGLLPDEYFSFSGKYEGLTGELPEFEEAFASRISVPARESTWIFPWPAGTAMANGISNLSPPARRWAKPADDYFRMFRIAAECSLMLNGRGFSYERNNVNIVLTEKEAAAVANSVELDLCGYLEPEAEALLSSALEKFAGAPARPSRPSPVMDATITLSGMWRFRPICSAPLSVKRRKRWGTLEELMDSMDATTGCEMRLLTQMKDGRFAFFSIPERMNGLRDYETQGSSTRGSKEQIMADIFTDWEPAEEPEDELER